MKNENAEEQRITAVEAQQRHPHRYNISVNGEFAFAVHEDVVVKFRLLKGTLLSDALREEVLSEEELNAAYRAAVRYIGRAMRSDKEVRDKLKEKGYAPEIIQQVAERMAEQRYVDDEIYASALARQRLRSNKKGPLWIRRELSQKGVDKTKVEQALTQFNKDDEMEQAWQLAAKRWNSTKGELPDRLRKMMGLLQRRGFTSEAVRYVTDRLRKSVSDDSIVDWDGWNGAEDE